MEYTKEELLEAKRRVAAFEIASALVEKEIESG